MTSQKRINNRIGALATAYPSPLQISPFCKGAAYRKRSSERTSASSAPILRIAR